jgi:hypothetical protein
VSRLVVSVVSACALALILASSAEAATYCVNKTPCPDAGTVKTTIQLALDDASNDGSPATVYIGANGGVPYTGTDNFDYNSGTSVHLVGDGVGQTILQGTAAGNINDRQTLSLLGSSGSTVADMTIIGPTVNGGGERALVFRGTASRLEIVQNGAPAGAAVDARVFATLENSSISTDVSALFTAINTTSLTIRDSTITAPNNSGISVDGGDTLNLQRTTITSAGRTVQVSGAGTTATLTNVVLRKTVGSPTFGIVTALGDATVTARHATMIGPGSGRGLDIDNLPNATATLRDSIIANVAVPIFCASNNATHSSMTVAYSNFGPGSDVSDPECDETLSNNDTTSTPAFVDAGNGDYRLIGGSPLINAADPADPIGNDFVNTLRPVGGRSDIGAYEYKATPPVAVLGGPTTLAIGESADLNAGNSTDADGDPLTFAWDFGDGSTGTGSAVAHAFAAAGSYVVTLTATDSAGISSTATKTIEVAANTPPPVVEPKLIGLKANPRKVKARKSAPILVPGGQKGLVFELSAAAKLTLTLERCKGKHGCSKTKAIRGSAEFEAPTGGSAIVFKGSLDGKNKLRKGRYIAMLAVEGGDRATAKLKVV